MIEAAWSCTPFPVQGDSIPSSWVPNILHTCCKLLSCAKIPLSSTAKFFRTPRCCMTATKHQNATASSSISNRNGSSRSDILRSREAVQVLTGQNASSLHDQTWESLDSLPSTRREDSPLGLPVCMTGTLWHSSCTVGVQMTMWPNSPCQQQACDISLHHFSPCLPLAVPCIRVVQRIRRQQSNHPGRLSLALSHHMC